MKSIFRDEERLFCSKLPIERYRKAILYLLETNNVLIIIGETGSGKSTRIPQFLFSSGLFNNAIDKNDLKTHQMICITQPRRVAAIQLSQRVSQDMRCELGSTVGYTIRFKDVSDKQNTMIKFITEGILIREMMQDPLLHRYSVIMIDEVHERNISTDLLMGLLKCILLKRADLKVIICSATIGITSIRDFFTYDNSGDSSKNSIKSTGLRVQGKSYPLKLYYLNKPVANYLDSSVDTVIRIHESSRLASGKILIFLTGIDEVDHVCDRLRDYAKMSSSRLDLRKLVVLALHSSLKQEEISKVFEEVSSNTRVCIVSTNVAETSLTIEDVAFVVDCGFAKTKYYNNVCGIHSLVRLPISKSSARQRAGRAGRTREGYVYRLYPVEEYSKLEDDTVPEIQRSCLMETIMLMKSLGVENIQNFPLVSPMPRHNQVAALELLYALGAVTETGRLTDSGQMMSQLNLDPKISKILIDASSSLCKVEACRIAAMLQVKEIFVKPGSRGQSLWANGSLSNICVSEGDIPSYLNILNGFISNQKSQKWAEKRHLNYQSLLNALEVSEKLEGKLRSLGMRITSTNIRLETIQKCVVSGLFSNAAYLHPSGDYKTIKGDQTVYIHPTSIFSEILERPKYLVYGDILNTTKLYIRHLMSVDQSWLLDAAPRFYTFATDLELMRSNF